MAKRVPEKRSPGRGTFRHGFRQLYDDFGFSNDPIEHAEQIRKIENMAKDGDPDAINWWDEFSKNNHNQLPLFQSFYKWNGPTNRNLKSTGFDLTINPTSYWRSDQPDQDSYEYDLYMRKLNESAINGNKDSATILDEDNFMFLPTRDQPFHPKIFKNYQEHNNFIIDIEKDYYTNFTTNSDELDTLSIKFRDVYDKLLRAEGENNLFKKENEQLLSRLQYLSTSEKSLKKEMDELKKFLDGESTVIDTLHGPRRLIHINQGIVHDFGKIPPQNIDLENILLGSALKTGKLIQDVSQPYLTTMFYKETNQKIHNAMMNIKGTITKSKVIEKLRSERDLDSVGGPVYLDQLQEKGIDDPKVLYEYFEILETKYKKREVIRLTTDIQQEAFEDKEVDSISEWIRGIALKFMDVMPFRFKIYYDLKSIVGQTIGNFHKLIDRNGRPDISTGYSNLDKITHGISPGTLLYNGMRGKNGKTTLSTNVGDNVAQQNRHVLIFTYETSREEVIHKLIAKRARVNLEKLVYFDEDDPLTDTENARIDKASEEVQKLPIILEGRPADPEYVVRMARFYKGMYPDLSLVIIDGLQAFANKEMPKGKNKSDYLYDALTTFRNDVAIDLNTMVWVNGQLKADVEKRKSKRPMGSGDYSDCKGITEVADIAIQGYRPGKYFKGPQFQGWIAVWPTDTRSGTEHGRACRLGFEKEYGNVYMLPKSESTFDYAKYDALLNPTRTRKATESKE